MLQTLPDHEIAEGINSLNSKQREVFNVVLTRVKYYVKHDKHNVEPIHIFLSGSGGTGKSHLVKVIYNAILTILFYYCKDPEKQGVLLLGPTGISAVNTDGTTIHSGLGIKPEITLLGLNQKSTAALRNRLSDVKFLIIDELSMVSSDLWADIDSRLGEIFIMIPEKGFASLSVMTLADLLQVTPVRGKFIFSQLSNNDNMKHLLGLQLRNLFKYAELTEVVRQKDKLFIDLLKFELATLMMMLKSYSRQGLYMNLIKPIQMMSCTCMQRMNQPRKGMMLF